MFHNLIFYFLENQLLMDFAWDERKAHANQRKHGVSFFEVAEVFSD
jgi:hypothetical protein